MSEIAGGAAGRWRRRALALAAVATAFAVFAATAGAANVMIVKQGPLPEKAPPHVHYFNTIQAAVNATQARDWVLIAPGVYKEAVKVEKPHTDIWIRGMNRNTVILDGENKPGNGIEVFKDNNVWIENLTVRNFDTGKECSECGNEIWWNGGAGSESIGARGWYGSYLTAYDTGLNGSYGIFTGHERRGEWNHIYASGFNDSGIYLGACPECEAVINDATMEDNALGYSGSNSGGKLIMENSTFKHNGVGIAPNSENPGDAPPPQNGACHPVPYRKKGGRRLPKFESTEIEHCTVIENNRVEENNNFTVPVNGSTEVAPWGAGIELPGDYADLIENNTIVANPSNGILGFEYPNPFPPTGETIYFQFSGNKFAGNKFLGNGYLAPALNPKHDFAGDLTIAGGLFGEERSTNNCASGNTFTAPTYPENIEGTWGCQNKTTPNPNLGIAGVEYIIELQEVGRALRAGNVKAQPAPPAQPSMPNPCEGVPIRNELCP